MSDDDTMPWGDEPPNVYLERQMLAASAGESIDMDAFNEAVIAVSVGAFMEAGLTFDQAWDLVCERGDATAEITLDGDGLNIRLVWPEGHDGAAPT